MKNRNSQQVSEAEMINSGIFSNQFRESFEISLKKAVRKHCSFLEGVSNDLDDITLALISDLIHGTITKEKYKILKEKMPENKTRCNRLFGGDMYSMITFEKIILSDDTYEEQNTFVRNGVLVDNEEGSMMIDPEDGTYAILNASHLNNSLGSANLRKGIDYRDKVWQLFADGEKMRASVGEVQVMILQRYGCKIEKQDAQKITTSLNQDRVEFFKKLFGGKYTDSAAVEAAMDQIEDYGLRTSASFEVTHYVGSAARSFLKKNEKTLGEIVGQGLAKGDCAELNNKTARLIGELFKTTNQSPDEVFHVMRKMWRTIKTTK